MTQIDTQIDAAASGTFTLGGDLEVRRLGYGTMQLTGPGVWGDPRDPEQAVAVLRRVVELGVNLIDTADSYGPVVAEQLIKRALHPYPDDLVIATKAGLTRQGPDQWLPVGRPEYLRQQAELSLRNLGVDRIDLFQLHRIDPKVPLEDQLGALALLQEQGKIRHIGLSEVSIAEVEAASKLATIVSVQNRFNLADRSAEPLLDYATRHGIGFIPWFPLATGALARGDGPLAALAERHQVSPSQLALAWLLRRSPAMLPIPGTASVEHAEDNIAAARVQLTDDEFAALSDAARVIRIARMTSIPSPAPPEPDGIIAHPTGPRSDRLHAAVLTATEELLREGGYAAATVDAIAARSGVSKATIYKHWPSRTAVAAKAFGRMMADALPLPDTGSTVDDLTTQVRRVSAFYASDLGAVFAQLVAACVDDPSGAAYFREYFLAGRRAAIRTLWDRALERGDVEASIPVDDVIDVLFGPLIFRRLTGHYDLSDEAAASLARTALRGLLRSDASGPVAIHRERTSS